MIRGILFDFFGVFTPDISEAWFAERSHLFSREVFRGFANRLDAAEIDRTEYLHGLSAHTGDDPGSIIPNMNSRLAFSKDLIQFIRQLKPHYRIGLLSNAEGDWIDEILTTNSLRDLFDSLTVSSRVRLIKPQREIFLLAAERLGLSPAEIVFTDDREENVTAATQYGFQAMRYVDVPTFIRDLHEKGVELH